MTLPLWPVSAAIGQEFFPPYCSRTEVWLPAASKAHMQEAGADEKESGFIQVPAT